jgi:hypothetical protein
MIHNFSTGSPNDHSCKVTIQLAWWFLTRRFFKFQLVHPSVSFSHLTLLLWNRWTDFNQTCHKCSLDGPLPDLCLWCWFEIQHGVCWRRPSLMEVGVTGHNFESWPPKDHSCHVCFKLTYWFQRRRLLNIISIGFYVLHPRWSPSADIVFI